MTWLLVWDYQGALTRVDALEEPRIRAAVQAFIVSGDDKLIDILAVHGATHTCRVSDLKEWALSTPEYRAAADSLSSALDGEIPAEWEE